MGIYQRIGVSMRKIAKLLSLFVLICALVCVFAACGEGETASENNSVVVDSQGIAYRLNSDETGYIVAGVSSYKLSKIVIPEKIKGKPVVAIQNGAFEYNSFITEFSIPSTVVSIGDNAFSSCAILGKVTFKADSTLNSIGDYAFSNCKNLAWVSLPESLVTIGDGVFEASSSLGSMTIPASVENIGDRVFYDCKKLARVIFANGSPLTALGDEAFVGCISLTSVTLPKDLTEVSDSAFFGCSSITNINLPDTVVTVGDYAFYGCAAIVDFTIPEAVEAIGASAFNNCQRLQSVVFEGDSNLKEVGAHAFENCLRLSQVVIPDALEIIGNRAFYNCVDLANVTFGENSLLNFIDEEAFVGCKTMTNIALPKTLVTIGAGAFSSLENLAEVTIPDESRLTTISKNAFSNCDNLVSITFGDNSILKTVEEKAFFDCDKLLTVDFGPYSALEKIGANAFNSCDVLFSFTVPVNVNTIGSNAFANCFKLVEVNDLSDSLELVAGDASNGGVARFAKEIVSETDLATRIRISEDGYVTYEDGINVSLVSYMGEDTSLKIPYTVTDINQYAFFRNTSIKNVSYQFGSRLTYIANNAFDGCASLNTFEIPTAVSEIGYNAFNNCTAVTDIYYNAIYCDDMTYDTRAFHAVGSATSGTTLTVGCDVKRIPSYAFYSSGTLPKIKTLSYADDVTIEEIGDFAFKNNSYITSLYLPASMREMGVSAFENTVLVDVTIEDENWLYAIEKKAFYNCQALKSVDFGTKSYVAEIKQQAFENCTALERVTIGDESGMIGIYENAFRNCINLTSFEMTEWLGYIKEDAFYNCYRLAEIIDNATYLDVTIGSEENGGLGLYAIVVREGAEISNVRVDEDGYTVYEDGEHSILLNYVGGETELVVPEYITEINKYAFRDHKITSLSFVENSALTTIGDNAFIGCADITSIEIPKNVTTIGNGAYEGLTSLSTVYYNAENCTSIQEDTGLFDGAGVEGGFRLVVGNTVLNLPAYIGYSTDSDTSDFIINEVTFAEGSKCKTIGEYAFYDNKVIQSISIPASVETIGNYAFKDCTKIQSINLSKTGVLKNIGTRAFENCIGVTSLSIPASVSDIAPDAFDGLTRVLTSISVDSANKTYHSSGNCLIKTSNKALLMGCDNSVIPNYVVTIEAGAFKNCRNLKSVIIPSTVKSIGEEAFYWCSSLNSVVIEGNNLKSIGEDAFVYCSSLMRIELPKSVKDIGSYAFLYCSNLYAIHYGGTIDDWNLVDKHIMWNFKAPASEVKCSDGNVAL